MNSEKFKVVFTGQLTQENEANSVAKAFADKFKIPLEKAQKIVQAKREIVISKSAEHVKAYKLKSTLEEIGMKARLERVLIKPPVTPAPTNVEEKETQSQAEDNPPDNVKETGNNAWSIEKIDTPSASSENQNTALPQQPITTNDATISYSTEPEEGLFKKFGGAIAAIGAGLLIFLKKFGLFKLLKLGLIFGAASAVIGFDGDEACMGNSRCESAVNKQIDDCWEDNGFDDIDWDEISDDAFFNYKSKIENEFIACFRYPDSGERIFVSPIDLRFMLTDFCLDSDVKNCNEVIEPQIKGCYSKSGLSRLFPDGTTDYYEILGENAEKVTDFYSCFVDEQGNQLIEMGYDN